MTESSNQTLNGVSSPINYTTPTPRFSVKNDETLGAGIAYLNEHGYAIISDVIDQDEINVNKNLLWKFLTIRFDEMSQTRGPTNGKDNPVSIT